MPLFSSWTGKSRQKKLAARKIIVPEIGWTLQLPLSFTPENIEQTKLSYAVSRHSMGPANSISIYHEDKNSRILFGANADRMNRFSAEITPIAGFTEYQIQISRGDCRERLARSFPSTTETYTEISSSSCQVGGKSFEEHAFLLVRIKKPILCFEYLCQTIGEYEMTFSITYNNETYRQEMFKCLEESIFA